MTYLPNGGIDTEAISKAALNDFTPTLASQRFWHIVPANGNTATSLYDAQTGLSYPLASDLEDFLKAHPFLRQGCSLLIR